MVTRKVKFKISIKELQMEFEGTQDLGHQIQRGVTQALGGLMNAQAHLLTAAPEPATVIDAEVSGSGVANADGPVDQDGNGGKPKQPRQRKTRGGSLIGLLRGLKQEGFFTQARPVSEIKDRLKDKGHNYTDSNISARLQDLTKKDELFRGKSGEEGPYVYKDTPFNESPRSPNPAEQPPQ